MIEEPEIFKVAAALPEAERSAYLDAACSGHPEVRARVEELLRSHDVSGFMEAQAAESLSPAIEAELARLKPEEIGERIGHYKLLEQIGEGGFGTVWVADQEQPVRRRVALKIIKMGMDTKEVIARFEQERQALALMDHPNIAKVFDAGATQWGRPYFVMELVRGIKITDYCDKANLPTAERLQLFIQVCHAVQHAHQKGIIHRDLKPSNILVTLHDGVPVPKVIDFGVAKATQQQRLTDLTVYTQFEQMIGTPLYMSPEQAEMSGLDVDTRSDIYSLGVLLYELLTGRTPFDPEELMRQGLDEIRRTIREQEPQTPSMFVRTLALDARTSVAQHRQTDGAKLVGLIRGDLDWIVMKALEKDRARRYETANGFARDIQRHLENEPVHASPPSQLYRFRRLLKRNKAAFVTGTVVAATLIIGTAVSIWQAARANAALEDLRATAPTFAAQAHALVLKGRFPDAIEKLEYAIKLRPDSAEYLFAKGDLLECQFRFAEAANVYRAVLRVSPGNVRGTSNVVLCEKLGAEQRAQANLSIGSFAELMATMVSEHRSAAEMMPVARSGKADGKLVRDFWLDRLSDLPMPPDRPLASRLVISEEGLCLDLRGVDIEDLHPLEGMPLNKLDLSGCSGISDLGPIRDLPLRVLLLMGTNVADLSPLGQIHTLRTLTLESPKIHDLSGLRGLSLHEVTLFETSVSDLSPLHGMPIESLVLQWSPVRNLGPLTGMPLLKLNCREIPAGDFSPLAGAPLQVLLLQTSAVEDLNFLRDLPLKILRLNGRNITSHFNVLAGLKNLEALVLPQFVMRAPLDELTAIDALRAHPTLRQIQIGSPSSLNTWEPSVQSKEAFWKTWDRDFPWIARLHRAGVKFTFSFSGGDGDPGPSAVSINDKQFADLTALRGARIEQLDLKHTQVADLTPLQGLPLRTIELEGTRIDDLTPLAGMPLEGVWVSETKITDLTPLHGMHLRSLDLRDTRVADLSSLRGMPLRNLYIQHTKVLDLSPLADLPLTDIYLEGIPATDLTPLGKISTLKMLILPNHEANVAPLRKLAKLERLSYSFDARVNGPSMSTAEFWADNDTLEAAKQLVNGDYAGATTALKNVIESTSKTLGPESKGTVVAKGQLAKCYVWQGHFEEAVPLFREIVAIHRKLKENERDPDHWVRLAATLAAAGNAVGYRATCTDMVHIFEGTKDKAAADRVIKTCTIAPDSGVGENELRQLTGLAEHQKDGNLSPWYFASAAIVEFRAGRWIGAEEMAKNISGNGIAPVTMGNALVAMIRQHEGRPDEARAMLAQTRIEIDGHWPPKKDNDGTPWHNWHDWLIARLFVLEAERMIAPPQNR